MTGFFSKLFGGGKKKSENEVESLVRETLEGLFEKAKLDLDFETRFEKTAEGEDTIHVEISGGDEDLLKDKEGQMIDAVQLFLKRVAQHNFADDKTNIIVDCNGFKEDSSAQLIELAEKLKGIALEKGKSVYFRALPPKDRKVIHQYLANDTRVKSRSIGDGLFKKIKIYPVKPGNEKSSDFNSEN
jgi:spoIIIJ-associated protein